MKKPSLGQFAFLGILSSLVYLTFFLRAPLRIDSAGEEVRLVSSSFQIADSATLLLLFFIYIAIFFTAPLEKFPLKAIFIFATIFGLLLVPVFPIGSEDLFTYIYRARVFSQYGANPYLTPFAQYPSDAFYAALANSWVSNTAIYGPTFMLLASGLTFLGGDRLFTTLLLFKFVFLAIHLANTFLIQKITASKRATYLYAWNPFVVFELVANSHNDVLLIFFFLTSLFYLLRKRSFGSYLVSWLFFVGSVLTKFITLVLLPFYLVFVNRELGERRERKRFFSLASILGLALLAVFYLPFWEGTRIFARLSQLLAIEDKRLSSPGILVLASLFSRVKIIDFYGLSKAINRMTFFGFWLMLVYRALLLERFNKKRLVFYLVAALSLFLATYLSWWLPWYLTLVVALACVAFGVTRNYDYSLFLFGISFYGIMFYLRLN